MSIDRGMDEETAAEIRDGVLRRCKEGNTAICNTMDLEGVLLSDTSQTKTNRIISLVCAI